MAIRFEAIRVLRRVGDPSAVPTPSRQALTALSLIFAVFRCQPAPVCVLDAMAIESGTRFLVVTHHPLTMARMHRLYGVTMQERGVSRLLSVDLGRAVEMVDGGAPGGAVQAAE